MAIEFLVSFAKEFPFLSITLFSLVLTFLLTWIYKKFTPQEELKRLRERTKELQQSVKQEKDPQKLAGIQKEMMQLSLEQMKHSFKPMLITFLPLILIFAGLKSLYTNAGVGDIVGWGANLPLIGTGAGWFLSYVILSLVFNIIIRKIMKVH